MQPLPYFSELLKGDVISAREEIIFQRLMQWIDNDEAKRSKHVPELLKLKKVR